MNEAEKKKHQLELNDKLTWLLNHRIKILVDLDDTIEDLVPCWIDALNRKYNRNIQYEDIDNWNISKYYPDLSEDEIFNVIRSDDFWKEVKPKKGAVEYLKKLYDEGYDVYICTSTYYLNIKQKFEFFIKRWFPFVRWHKVIITSNKQMIQADYLIDDFPNNLIGGNYKKLLMDAPYNRQFEDPEIERVKNWEEIYKILTRKCQSNTI